MDHYIHHINPILLPIAGPLAVRWYGLSYLLGFLFAILLLRRWSRRGEFEVPLPEVSNFIALLAFFGVMLGGRLGYVLFYELDRYLAAPLDIFKVWDGGMSSHGGFVGVILFMLWYARRHRHSFWNLADNMACTASLGFAFGRLANFVNGELWGRVSDVKWAVIFPLEAGLKYGEYDLQSIHDMVSAGRLQPRHPSQLYQAACEGFLVFGLMMLLRRTAWGQRPGALSAAYLVLYATARFAMEFFREPDSTIYFGWVSKGQFYSALMLAAAFLIAAARGLWNRPEPGPTR